MNHLKERTEKICLNCNAATYGRFCHVCGQENVETKESFWSLVTHFIYDIIHFDGKFWKTLKYLLFKPGFLTKEYIYGRRTSYLHPIRMYIFTSAFFFLIIFTFYSNLDAINFSDRKNDTEKNTYNASATQEKLSEIKEKLEPGLNDSTKIFIKDEIINILDKIKSDSLKLSIDTNYKTNINFLSYVENNARLVSFNDMQYKSLEQYDSIQSSLAKNKKDGFIARYFQHKTLEFKKAGENLSSKELNRKFLESILHKIPQILFTSLPFFAFGLFVLFARKKQYFFTNHVVFTLHLYCGIFIIMLLIRWFKSFSNFVGFAEGAIPFLYLFILVFWYKSFRNFYTQPRLKTLAKQFILFFFVVFISGILFSVFAFFAATSIH